MEVTELGPMKRALKIEVPAEEVNQRFIRAYTELNKQVHIPGFRPGKAPVPLLEKTVRESGGTGRRARLRISWETVGVQVPPLAPSRHARR